MGRISLFFAWYDFWVGIYWDHKRRMLYILPVPMFGIRIDLSPRVEKFCVACFETMVVRETRLTCPRCKYNSLILNNDVKKE